MSPLMVPIVALMIPLIVTPTSLWLRHRLKVRQMEHDERIKALELGVIPRSSGISWPGASICVAIGAGVPVGSMVVTWLAMLTNDLPIEVWLAPVVISFPAIGTARKLADRMLLAAEESQLASARLRGGQGVTPGQKPAFDPDAYDVVGSRG